MEEYIILVEGEYLKVIIATASHKSKKLKGGDRVCEWLVANLLNYPSTHT